MRARTVRKHGFLVYMTDVLIVDDERTVRAAYRKLFEGEGFSVRVARNGAEAIASFRERRPDIVLLDIDMPGMNGFTVCRTLREEDKATPILFLTALESDADQMRGLGLGADDYVFKTSSRSVLLARVSSVLARSAVYRESASALLRQLHVGRASVDMSTYEVSLDGKPTGEVLTRTEARMLEALVSAKGSVVSFSDLARESGSCAATTNTTRTHIAKLKSKLGQAGELLVNEREVGYRIVV